MGMSEWYGPRDDRESVATIHAAFDDGLNFFDTADVYGNGHNEKLLGGAVRAFRHEVIVATKFGFLPDESGLDARPEYVKAACDASLSRLGTDYIDLYYLHRIDPLVPLTETWAAMAGLVTAGKVRCLGLSEVSAASLRLAHTIHPVTALQSEYSVWVRDLEPDIMPVCRELGIAIVPYSPLGRGRQYENRGRTGIDRQNQKLYCKPARAGLVESPGRRCLPDTGHQAEDLAEGEYRFPGNRPGR